MGTPAFFSSFDHDGHFEESIVDEGFDVDKIVQTHDRGSKRCTIKIK